MQGQAGLGVPVQARLDSVPVQGQAGLCIVPYHPDTHLPATLYPTHPGYTPPGWPWLYRHRCTEHVQGGPRAVTRLSTSKWKYYLPWPNLHCVRTTTLAGARCPNYFPERVNDTGFNSTKCKRYFSSLKAKGILSALKREMKRIMGNTNLHGTRYMTKSRSTAGSFSQTAHPDLVVSRVDGCILLPSVFPFRVIDTNLAVFVNNRSFSSLVKTSRILSIMARTRQ